MKLKALQELSQRTDIEKLIYIDSDIAVFNNFFPEFYRCLQIHPLWFQCDESREDDFTCSNQDKCTNACTGVIAMLLNDETREMFNTLYAIDENWKTAVTDQDYINNKLKEQNISYKSLSRELFPNGRLLSNDKYKERNPLLLHFNYISGIQKKGFMVNKNCWFVPL
jgi:lipopolysaccharide biosynthesis glycosyltransferase